MPAAVPSLRQSTPAPASSCTTKNTACVAAVRRAGTPVPVLATSRVPAAVPSLRQSAQPVLPGAVKKRVPRAATSSLGATSARTCTTVVLPLFMSPRASPSTSASPVKNAVPFTRVSPRSSWPKNPQPPTRQNPTVQLASWTVPASVPSLCQRSERPARKKRLPPAPVMSWMKGSL